MGFVPRTPVLVVRCHLAVVRRHLVVRLSLGANARPDALLYVHIPLPTSLYPYTRLHISTRPRAVIYA